MVESGGSEEVEPVDSDEAREIEVLRIASAGSSPP
jgi:hypothetical protein